MLYIYERVIRGVGWVGGGACDNTPFAILMATFIDDQHNILRLLYIICCLEIISQNDCWNNRAQGGDFSCIIQER